MTRKINSQSGAHLSGGGAEAAGVGAGCARGLRALRLGSLDPADAGRPAVGLQEQVGAPGGGSATCGRVTAPALTAGPRLSLERKEAESTQPDQVAHLPDSASHGSHG